MPWHVDNNAMRIDACSKAHKTARDHTKHDNHSYSNLNVLITHEKPGAEPTARRYASTAA